MRFALSAYVARAAERDEAALRNNRCIITIQDAEFNRRIILERNDSNMRIEHPEGAASLGLSLSPH